MRYLTLFHHEVGNDWSYIHEKSFKDLAPALSGKIAKPEEGLHISCYYCRKELTEPGALIFGIPNDKEIIFVTKKHICKDCYSRLEIGKPEGGIMPKLTPCPACGDLHKEPPEKNLSKNNLLTIKNCLVYCKHRLNDHPEAGLHTTGCKVGYINEVLKKLGIYEPIKECECKEPETGSLDLNQTGNCYRCGKPIKQICRCKRPQVGIKPNWCCYCNKPIPEKFPISVCCNASVKSYDTETQYYRCNACGNVCNLSAGYKPQSPECSCDYPKMKATIGK